MLLNQEPTKNLLLLKANAIRFHCLAKEVKIQYKKKSPNYDSNKIWIDLHYLYEKIAEADTFFNESLSKTGPQIEMARGLCYF